jgi:hypothetical protein
MNMMSNFLFSTGRNQVHKRLTFQDLRTPQALPLTHIPSNISMANYFINLYKKYNNTKLTAYKGADNSPGRQTLIFTL